MRRLALSTLKWMLILSCPSCVAHGSLGHPRLNSFLGVPRVLPQLPPLPLQGPDPAGPKAPCLGGEGERLAPPQRWAKLPFVEEKVS